MDINQQAERDKFYITEIINDLHRHGFIIGGKAMELLHCWSAELRDKNVAFPRTRLKKEFIKKVGKGLW